MALSPFLFTTLLYATIFSFNAATKVLPRAAHPDIQTPAFVEFHNVIVNPRRDLNIGTVVHPRLNVPAPPVQKRLSSPESSAAAVKRTLLGARQSCDAGYGYCYRSGKCCPNGGDNGQCCDDGTCVTSTQTCCLYGGACDNGRDCCVYGCKPKGNSCCSGGKTCYPGYFCCNNGNCAPNGGECCDNGDACGNGLHCVLYDGKQTCCKDLSCSEYAYGAIGGGATPESIPSVTTSSFTSGPLPSHSPSTMSGTSLPPATTEGVTFEYYYTTWKWRYYYYFLTSTTVTTSTYTTTSTVVSVYASASSAAELNFARLSAETTFPTATTAAEVTAAPKPTIQSPKSASTASAVGGATRHRGRVGWGISSIAVCAVATGIGMVWL